MRRRCVHWDWWVDCDSEYHTCEKREAMSMEEYIKLKLILRRECI